MPSNKTSRRFPLCPNQRADIGTAQHAPSPTLYAKLEPRFRFGGGRGGGPMPSRSILGEGEGPHAFSVKYGDPKPPRSKMGIPSLLSQIWGSQASSVKYGDPKPPRSNMGIPSLLGQISGSQASSVKYGDPKPPRSNMGIPSLLGQIWGSRAFSVTWGGVNCVLGQILRGLPISSRSKMGVSSLIGQIGGRGSKPYRSNRRPRFQALSVK